MHEEWLDLISKAMFHTQNLHMHPYMELLRLAVSFKKQYTLHETCLCKFQDFTKIKTILLITGWSFKIQSL